MRGFKTFLPEDLDDLQYSGSDTAFALSVLSKIDDEIGSINTEIEVDVRPGKNSGRKLGVSQRAPDKDREKFAGLARDIIDAHPDLELMMDKVSAGRKEKDYAFGHKDLEKYVYFDDEFMSEDVIQNIYNEFVLLFKYLPELKEIFLLKERQPEQLDF